MDQRLQDFTRQIAEQTKAVQSLHGDEAMAAQTKLSLYIGEQMQVLLAAGLNVYDIQDCMRAAMEEPSPATDTEETSSDEEASEEITSMDDINPATHFVALNEELIRQFETGAISKQDFIHHLTVGKHFASDAIELIAAVLGGYGKTDAFEIIDEGGEILAGADGEALIPEWLEFEESNGPRYAMCDPMTYKTVEETGQVYSLIASVDEEAFSKRWDIKKLIKSQEISGDEAKIMKKQSDELLLATLENYTQLLHFYKEAADSGKAVVVFYTY